MRFIMAKKKMPSKGPSAVARKAGVRSGNGFAGKGSSSKPIAAAKGEPGAKLNPFERLWNRRKFDVLGKKTKGEQRKIGQSRSRAVEMVRFRHFVCLLSTLLVHCCLIMLSDVALDTSSVNTLVHCCSIVLSEVALKGRKMLFESDRSRGG
jgi:hypothetical protein